MRTDTLLHATAMLLLIAAAVIASQGTNEGVFLWFNAESQVLPAWFWSNMTFVADTLFAVAVIGTVASRAPHMFNTAFVLLITGTAFVHGLKFLLEIPRPPAVLDPDVFNVIGPVVKNHAFPSGHSFTALATAGLIMVYTRSTPCAVAVLVIALVAAASRAAVGAHWPLDILVGSASGLIFAALAKYLTESQWWLQGEKLERFTAALLTITSVVLIFHQSKYPDTQFLSIGGGVIATLCLTRYWSTLVKQMRK